MARTVGDDRRWFLKTAGLTAAAVSFGSLGDGVSPASAAAAQDHGKPSLRLALASYTTREFSLDETIAILEQLDLKHVCLKSFHLPLDASDEELVAARKKLENAGIELYGGGVIYMRSGEQVEQAFHYAKTAGMEMIVGSTTHELVPLVDEQIRETGVAVAIHNHGPGDQHFPTPESAYERIQDCDPRFGLCMDIGHTVRAGVDPVTDIKRFADRLLDIHLKDIDKADPSGKAIEAGRGVIDLVGVVQALLEIEYSGRAAFEFEKDRKDPRMGLAESVGYIRGILAAV